MKKLAKIESRFASLENKELENLEKVIGGAIASTYTKRTTTENSDGSVTTTTTWDNGKVTSITVGPIE